MRPFVRHAALAAFSLVLTAPAPPVSAAGAPVDGAAIQQGEYLARVGDCAACHTAEGGPAFAGGKAIETPFGVIYSTNITPDAATGIGQYTFAQFDQALRAGIAADGHRLYPAMPYPSFAKLDEGDMRALYAYFLKGVAPVRQANRDTELRWPFNMRFTLAGWDWLFLEREPYRPDAAKSMQWNRGAYLVQGLGHCGACHTPRGLAQQEKALDDGGSAGRSYLAGAALNQWSAPSLRGLWAADDYATFLKSGRNRHGAAFGTMTEVIHFSTQGMSDGDLAAVGEYLASLPRGGGEAGAAAPPAPTPEQQSAALYKTRGGLGYVQFCSGCHRLDGSGAGAVFPPLGGNAAVVDADPTSVIHVVLTGWQSAQTAQTPRGFWMPSFSELTDRELAEILSFVRSSWGNHAAAIGAGDIRTLREGLALKSGPPSAFVTPRFADLVDRPNANLLIYGMRLNLDTKALLPDHVGVNMACGSCHLNAGTVALSAPYVGVSALFPMYQPRAGRTIDFKDRINGCMLRSMNGRPLDKDSREMAAMVAFSDWMQADGAAKGAIPGRGMAEIDRKLVPDAARGERLYAEQCAACHGEHGEGTRRADGSYDFPPLWGDDSFNIGAGMARTYTAASFVKANMPVANSAKFPMGEGGLTDQQAVDVAEYFTHMPRGDFAAKVRDWPNGGRPPDARY
jgi:thiosulfate dehydrogenase